MKLKKVAGPWLVAMMVLAACGKAASANPNESTGRTEAPAQNIDPEQARIERALLNQISCVRPPQAGIAMTAMLRRHLIAKSNDGGDGIVLLVPVRPMSLMGFPIIRLGGWQADPAGGAMPPFSRGPGTAPPNHIFVTVKAPIESVRNQLKSLGIKEMKYVPDLSQDAWIDSRGELIQPQRKIPGPEIEAVDGNGYASRPVEGAVTIMCSAEEYDFSKDAEAQFSK